MKIPTYAALFFGIALLVLASCGSKSAEKVSSEKKGTETKEQNVLDKLVGTWKNENGKEFECWTKKGDALYQSVVYSLQGKDTVFHEHASVYNENGKWIFENVVKGQNNDEKIRFTSSILNEKTIQFSNPQHDFPTDINYTMPDLNTIHAFITGKNEQGKADTIPFNYSRVL